MAERIEDRDLLEAPRTRIVEGPWVEPSPRRVRVYFNEHRLYVVRAYGLRKHMEGSEADWRKLLDSFTILDGQ